MNIEHEHQKALIHWWAFEANRRGLDARTLMAIPNQGRGGGWRQARRGAYMKQEGLRAGVPDLFLAIPAQGYHGLFIELKSEKGRLSDAQDEMIRILMAHGYVCRVARGWTEAQEAIIGYLGSAK
jgi:hypothetical protein